MASRKRTILFCMSFVLFTACGSTQSGFQTDVNQNDSGFDATETSVTCRTPNWDCPPGSGQARQCDPSGNVINVVDCASMGLVCAPSVGCTTCLSGQRRCNPDAPDTTQ